MKEDDGQASITGDENPEKDYAAADRRYQEKLDQAEVDRRVKERTHHRQINSRSR